MSSRRRGVVAAALLVALVGASGCQASTSDAVAKALRGTLEMQDYELDDVTCPDGLELEGDSVTCEVTIAGKAYPVKATSNGSGGSRGVDVDYDLSQLPQP